MISLVSEIGADYSQLLKLLESQNWKAAEQETTALMSWIGYELPDNHSDDSSRVARGLRRRGPEFPCRDLMTIDQLWMHHSDKRFGFSAQVAIYEEFIAKIQADHMLEVSISDHSTEKIWINSRNSPPPSQDQLAALLSDRFGWPSNEQHSSDIPYSRKELIFSLSAPVGHLPAGVIRALGSDSLLLDDTKEGLFPAFGDRTKAAAQTSVDCTQPELKALVLRRQFHLNLRVLGDEFFGSPKAGKSRVFL